MALTSVRNIELPENKITGKSEELHVLAVDDSLVDQKLIERLLMISSCKVTAVESGIRALQFLGLDGAGQNSVGSFDGLKVNLIMTDYSMPGMTGYELLKKLKTSSSLRKIPVVVMSSENIVARIDRCLEEGAQDFLVKPVKLSDVERLKECILNGEGDHKEIKPQKRKLINDPSSVLLPAIKQKDEPSSSVLPQVKKLKDPSSVLPLARRLKDWQASSLLPSGLACDPSQLLPCPSYSSSQSLSKRRRL